jgi:translation initiation factor 2B subunit (eIF-2B alpha/beta/delta family)
MDRVDLVIVGSEAVVESGGLVAGVRPSPLAVILVRRTC